LAWAFAGSTAQRSEPHVEIIAIAAIVDFLKDVTYYDLSRPEAMIRSTGA